MTDLPLPLNQSHAFERTCVALGLSVRRVSSEQGTCLIQSRKLPVIGVFHLISRGPVAADPKSATEFIRTLRQSIDGPLVVNAPVGLEQIGGFKVAEGAELALIDLIAPDNMRRRMQQKWRNQLKKAERSGLKIKDAPLDATQHKWFLEAEAAQQKSRGYK